MVPPSPIRPSPPEVGTFHRKTLEIVGSERPDKLIRTPGGDVILGCSSQMSHSTAVLASHSYSAQNRAWRLGVLMGRAVLHGAGLKRTLDRDRAVRPRNSQLASFRSDLYKRRRSQVAAPLSRPRRVHTACGRASSSGPIMISRYWGKGVNKPARPESPRTSSLAGRVTATLEDLTARDLRHEAGSLSDQRLQAQPRAPKGIRAHPDTWDPASSQTRRTQIDIRTKLGLAAPPALGADRA